MALQDCQHKRCYDVWAKSHACNVLMLVQADRHMDNMHVTCSQISHDLISCSNISPERNMPHLFLANANASTS